MNETTIYGRCSLCNFSVISSTDYYAFGSPVPGRSFSIGSYRYGFNGMERDNEMSGAGNNYYTEWRPYDPRVGRWWSVDRLDTKFPWWTPYQFAGNMPTRFVDIDGLEPAEPGSSPGETDVARDNSAETGDNREYGWTWFEEVGWQKGSEVLKVEAEKSPPQNLRHVNDIDLFKSRGQFIAETILSDKRGTHDHEITPYTKKDVINLARDMYSKASWPLNNMANSQDASNIPERYLEEALTLLILDSPGLTANTYWGPQTGQIVPLFIEDAFVLPGAVRQMVRVLIKLNFSENTSQNQGNYSVYQGLDKADKVRYVGITKREPSARYNEHTNSNTPRSELKYNVVGGATNLSRNSARVFEQRLINKYGLQKNGGQLFNKNNSIAPKNWPNHGIK